ncbi:hypothetical protein NUW58_g6600 [Xylaria curta]|uniref:Uncharacterized protein n=1 Tax=Xylaria curta TaxID=42375 RepID=A0ACC1NRS8_9PEZI|nr:hypothetical protein NUW58_g6600 [Xylaria curta]
MQADGVNGQPPHRGREAADNTTAQHLIGRRSPPIRQKSRLGNWLEGNPSQCIETRLRGLGTSRPTGVISWPERDLDAVGTRTSYHTWKSLIPSTWGDITFLPEVLQMLPTTERVEV